MSPDLINNILLILALCFVYRFVVERWPGDELVGRLASGLLFGSVACIAMYSSFRFESGIIFDSRTVVLSMGGLFGGPIAGGVAALVAGGYRIYLGGAGTIVGIANIVSAVLIGLLFRLFYRDRLATIALGPLFVAGLTVHLVAIGWLALLPIEFIEDVLGKIAGPFGAFMSIGTVALGLLLREIEKIRNFDAIRKDADDRFETLFNSSATAMFEDDLSAVVRRLRTLRQSGITDLRGHLDAHPDLLMQFARDVKILHANPAAVRLFRAPSAHNLIGNLEKYFGSGSIKDFTDELCAFWDGADIFTHDVNIRARDGAMLSCVISLPIPKTERAARRVPVSVTDITPRKEAERKLAEERRRLGEILWGTNAGTWEWNIQTGETIFNERWAEIVGYTLDELAPISIETWNRLAHPDDLKIAEGCLDKIFSHQTEHYQSIVRMRRKDGGWVWVLDRGRVVEWTPDGKPLRMSGTHTDITEIKLLEESLKISRAELQEAQRLAAMGSWHVDFASGETEWTDELFQMHGLDPAMPVPDIDNIEHLFTPASWTRLRASMDDTINLGKPYELELETIKPDGTHGWIFARGEPVRDEGSTIVGLRGISIDITERKNAQRRIAFIGELYAALSECSAAVLRNEREDELYRAICEIVVERAGMKMVWIGIANSESGLLEPKGAAGIGQDYLDGIQISIRPGDPRSLGPTGTAIREDRAIWLDDFMNDPNTGPWHERGARYGWRSFAALPIHRRGQPVGGLVFYANEVGFFDDETRHLLIRIAEQLSFALDKRDSEHELERSFAAIRASEQRFRSIFENSPLGIAVTDAYDGLIYDVNPKFAAISGWDRGELLSKRWQDITYPDDLPNDLALYERMKSGELASYGSRERYIRRDGSLVWVNKTVSRLAFGSIDNIRHLIMVEDVTESETMTRLLTEQEAKFRAIAEQSIVGIYTIDGDKMAYVNPYAANMFGYSVAEAVGHPAAEFIAPEDRARVNELIRERNTGEIKTLRYEFKGQRKDGSTLMVGVHSTTVQIDGRVVIMGVLQDITDRLRAQQEIQDYIARIEDMIVGTVDAISTMVELRDPYTSGHERRVGELSAAIAREMGLSVDTQRGLRLAGAVHDVGKLAIPAEILSKPGKLTSLEFEMVKGHAQQGYEMLKAIDSPWPLADVAHQHHERIDGSGYPHGLRGTDIILEARITAVADVVESMGSHRPYRPTLGIDRALAEIERGRGSAFDPDVVDACLRLFREKNYVMRSVS